MSNKQPSLGTSSTEVLVDEFINTAYDNVLLVANNITALLAIAAVITAGATIINSDNASDIMPSDLGTQAIGVSESYMREDAVISDILPATTTMLDGAAAITQAVDNSSTKIATTAFVIAQASALAPVSLGTAAVGVSTRYMREDAILSDILPATTTLLNGAAAITQAADDDTTKIATTAFVLAQASDIAPVSLGTAAAGTSEKYIRSDAIISDILPATTTNLDGSAAVTQSDNDNSTKLATTAYADVASDSKVAETITEDVSGIAPSQEVVFDALALKAPLASPALTGTPTAPTAANATDTTQVATTAFVQNLIKYWDLFIPKGALNCSLNPDFPAADAGWAYRVSVAGKIGGVFGSTVEVNDVLICWSDSTPSGNLATVGAAWSVSQVNLDPGLYALLSGATFTGDTIVPDQSAADNSTKAANTKYVDTADNLKANLAGGATFSGGAVIVPDKTADDNSTEVANTKYVDLANTLNAKLAGAAFTGSVEMSGATSHFMPPKLTTTQKNSLTSPQEGWVVFDTDLNSLQQYANGVWGSIGGGSSYIVNKAAHGFTAADEGTVVYQTTVLGVFAQGESDDTAKADAFWFISKYLDSSKYEIKSTGLVTKADWTALYGSASLTIGDNIWLGTGAGNHLVNTEPAVDGYIGKPVGVVFDTDTIWFQSLRGTEYNDSFGKYQTVTWAQCAGGVYDVTHNMDILNLHVTGRDSDGYEVSVYNRPKDGTNRNVLTFDFSGYVEADFPMQFAFNGTGSSNTLDMDNITVPSAPSGAGAAGSSSLAMPIDTVLPSQEILILKDVKANTANGGTFTSGSWSERDLNTIEGGITGYSVPVSFTDGDMDNNGSTPDGTQQRFTLPAGTYLLEGTAQANQVNTHQLRLYNVSDSSKEFAGGKGYADGSTEINNLAALLGIFTIASAKVFEIQQACQTTVSDIGFGRGNTDLGEGSVYTQIKITKIA